MPKEAEKAGVSDQGPPIQGERKLSQKAREVEYFRLLYDRIQETEHHLVNKSRELQALLNAQLQKSESSVQQIEIQKAKILELETNLNKADIERKDLNSQLFKLKEEAPSVAHSRVKTMGEHRKALEELNRRLKKEMAENEKLRANKEEAKEEGIQLRDEIRNQKKAMDDTRKEIEKKGEKIKEKEEALSEEVKRTDNELWAKLRIEEKLKLAKDDLEEQYNKFPEKEKELNETKETLKTTNAELEAEKFSGQFMEKRLEGLQTELATHQDERNGHLVTIGKLQEEAALKIEDIKKKDEDLAYWKTEVDLKVKERAHMERKYQKLEEAKEMADKLIDALKQRILNLEKDVDTKRKFNNKLSKNILDFTREKSAVNDELRKAIAAKEHEASMAKTHKNKVENLRKLNREINEELSNTRKKLSKSQNEAEVYWMDAKKLLKELNASINDNHRLNFKLNDSKKKLEAKNVEITKLKKASDHIMSLKNEHLKNFKAAQITVEDYQKKLRGLSFQIDTLKKEVMVQEKELIEKRKIIEKDEKEKVKLNEIIAHHKKQTDDASLENLIITNSNDKLRSALDIKSKEQAILASSVEQYIKDINKYKVKISVTSREIELWKEKCSLQSAVLERGRVEYVKRMQDIKLLKTELVQTLRMKEVLSKRASRIRDLHLDLRAADMKLVKQQATITAFETELSCPTNIHRWRILAGTDPNTHQLLEANQCLLNKLVAANAKVKKQKIELKEKNRLIQEMQSFTTRNNLLDAGGQLEQAEVLLRRKTEELKRISADRDMYSTICENEREQRNSLDRELHKLNEEYTAMRRALARKSEPFSLYLGDDESSLRVPSEAQQQKQ